MQKKRITIVIIVILLLIIAYFTYINITSRTEKKHKEVQVDNIEKYNYTLYDDQSDIYKDLFVQLKNVLNQEEIIEEEYVTIISQMFIIDFFTLNDKITNNDIGGCDFVHQDILDNFKLKANDTMYKYLESNIYGDRKQKLPIVSKITEVNVSSQSFKYNKSEDKNAYKVIIKWEYQKDLGYQKEAYLIFVHDDIKLSLVEMGK